MFLSATVRERGRSLIFLLSLRLPISPQDVFLMIRRHKTTIFTDAKESTTVYELKRIVEGILKRPPEDQRLYKVNHACIVPQPIEPMYRFNSDHNLLINRLPGMINGSIWIYQ